jgi:DNA-binding NarL/FixJ family response regulator
MRTQIGRKAILLDHHPLWLDAVESVLRAAGIEVVGKATDPDEAVSLLGTLQPDLLVAEIDLQHSGADGLAILRRVRSEFPEVRTIVLSQRDDPSLVASAFAAGATAYVVKTAHRDDVAVAVRQAFGQSLYFAGAATNGTADPFPSEEMPLTRREIEILALAAEGRSNATIARSLWVTEQTVKFHLSNVFRKLGVLNRTEASLWAQRRGLVSGDSWLPAQPEPPSASRASGMAMAARG